MRIAALTLAALAVLALAGGATAGSPYELHVVGAEVPPITSSLGTFVGATTSGPAAAWRIQITHEPLRTGSTVAVTGGSFSMRFRNGHALRSPVLGGSVTVARPGAHCTDQVYAVRVQLGSGAFSGTLTHHRRSLFHRCILYAATIGGRATLTG